MRMTRYDTEAKIELIRRYQSEPGPAEYQRGTDGTSFVRMRVADRWYAFPIKASEIPRLLNEFPVFSVKELFAGTSGNLSDN
jgi:hypothetical protein